MRGRAGIGRAAGRAILVLGSILVMAGGETAQGAQGVAAAAGPRKLWEARVVHAPAVPPLLGGDSLFVAGTDRRIVCLDARTGRRLWRRTLPGTVACAILRADSVLLVGIGPPTPGVIALDCGNGHVRWERRLDAPAAGITRSGGTVVVFSYRGDARGLALADGQEKWERTLKGPVAGMVLEDGYLVALARRDTLWSLAAADGKTVWAVPIGGTHAAPPILAGGRIIRLTYEGDLVAHDPSTGLEIARGRARAPQIMPPAVRDGTRCVTVATGGEAQGFDLPDLNESWSNATGETVAAGPVAAGDTWIVACESGDILGLDPESGAVAWTMKARRAISMMPAASDGRVVIVDDLGRALVFSVEGNP